MERDSIKWLIAGLAGTVFTLLLFIGIGVLIFLRMERTAPEGSFASIFDRATINADEEEEERKEAEKRAKRQAEEAARADRLGLPGIYTTIWLLPSTRHALYHEKNFDSVEKLLAAGLANTTTPFDRYRYSAMIDDLAVIYDDELPTLMNVADEWVTASPNSHYPHLLRAKLTRELAWEVRGSDYAHEVPRADMQKFEELNKKAKADLENARKINPNDSEIYAALAEVCAPIEGMGALRQYHDQVLALNPHHVGVRYTMMMYLQPQWYGSWDKLEAYATTIDTVEPSFPYLFTVRRDSYSLLEEPGNMYEGLWDSDETHRRMAAAFKAQLEQNPTEMTLMASAAYFAIQSGDLATAVGYFDRIGNQYPVVEEFPSLYSYHWWRVHAMAEYSIDPDVIGTPREKELLDAVFTLQADHAPANGLYLAYLCRTKDDARTQAFWDSLDGGFYKTGELGTPLSYERLQAMAFAARSQTYGVQGTGEERSALAQALALAPDNAFVQLAHAEYFIERDELEEAREHLECAREIDPAYLPALHTLGWLNYHQKRWDEGIAAANQFLASGDSRYVEQNRDGAKEIIELCEKKKARALASGK